MLNDCCNCGGTIIIILNDIYDTRFGIPGSYAIGRCENCYLEQTIPRPSYLELKKLYEDFYNFSGESATKYTRWREQLYQSLLYRLWLWLDGDIAFHRLKGQGKLLDIGCNEGRSLKIFSQHGFDAEGLELNKNAVAVAHSKGLKVHAMAIEDFYPDEPFDTVILSNVLEHALDPQQMLAHIHRILKPGGRLLISCPNSKSWLRNLFGRYWVNWHVPFHISHFSIKTLSNLLNLNKLDVVKIRNEVPALWITLSILSCMFARRNQPTKQMRNPFFIVILLGICRGFFFPVWWLVNRLHRGDCLIVESRKRA